MTTIIGLHKALDVDLLRRLYTEILKPCFGICPDELEELEVLENQLKHENFSMNAPYTLHIDVVVEDDQILAGICYEFYKQSNCGLVTYIATNPSIDTRGRGLGQKLLMNAIENLHKQARTYQGIDCAAIFLESNTDEIKNDVMLPTKRREILRTWGVRYLDFDFVQPKLAEDKLPCKTLHLAVWKEFLIQTPTNEYVMPSNLVAAFISNFYTVLMGSSSLTTDDDAIRQLKWLATNPFIKIMNE